MSGEITRISLEITASPMITEAWLLNDSLSQALSWLLITAS
jgi:hypothetical protein